MVATYRPPQVVERERRLAAALISRERLIPPVDVKSLVEQHATVTVEEVPGDCDAVVVGIQRADALPEVILQPSTNRQRMRFTLAHELGHLLLPWHLGTMACHVDTTDVADAHLHSLNESEANHFAAELLLPQSFLSELFKGSNRLNEVFRQLRTADVSAHVACLQLVRVLAPGWVFALLDDEDRVALSGRSPETDSKAPQVSQRVPASFDRFSDQAYELRHGYRTVRWWHVGGAATGPKPRGDTRTSTQILRDLTRLHARDDVEADTLFKSVSGAVGFAYGTIASSNPTERQLFGRLRSRFAGRDLPTDLLNDPDLDAYLVRRVQELKAKKRPPKP